MKSYEHLDTKHPDLFRVVDREGNWENYFHKPSGRYLRGITSVLSQGYYKGFGYDAWLSNKTPQERDEILRAAGERGDKIHRLIDLILSFPVTKHASYLLQRSITVFNRSTQREEPLSNDEWDATLAWTRFWLAHAPMVYASELSVYNLGVGYAGTGDAVLELTRACDVKTCKCEELIGKLGLFDWKTGGGIYASYWSQLSAVINADNIKDYCPHGRQIEYGAILRIGTNHVKTGGYELKACGLEGIAEAQQRFLAAKSIADFEHSPFDPESVYDIPDEIVIPLIVGDLKPVKKAKKPRKPKKLSTAAPGPVDPGQPQRRAKKSTKQ